MTHYAGSCHCGAVRFTFEAAEISKGLRCTCSLCSRRGALMSPEVIPREHLQFEAEDAALGLYQFGVMTAQHYFCTRCGIYTFHETTRVPDHYRVNLACVEGMDTSVLPFEVFDGKHLL